VSLFDAEVYGSATTKRRRKARPEEIRLNKPWVLLRHHAGPPMAHLTNNVVRAKPSERDIAAARNGAVRAKCGKFGKPLDVEGHPMAFVCHACWDLNQ
jgi:hypothetical protein